MTNHIHRLLKNLSKVQHLFYIKRGACNCNIVIKITWKALINIRGIIGISCFSTYWLIIIWRLCGMWFEQITVSTSGYFTLHSDCRTKKLSVKIMTEVWFKVPKATWSWGSHLVHKSSQGPCLQKENADLQLHISAAPLEVEGVDILTAR